MPEFTFLYGLFPCLEPEFRIWDSINAIPFFPFQYCPFFYRVIPGSTEDRGCSVTVWAYILLLGNSWSEYGVGHSNECLSWLYDVQI